MEEGRANLDAVDLAGKSALVHAVTRTGPSALFFLELLIAAGADLDIRDEAHGWTALHWAMYKRHFKVMAVLANAGADLNVQDAEGRTPLMVRNLRCSNDVEGAVQHGGLSVPASSEESP